MATIQPIEEKTSAPRPDALAGSDYRERLLAAVPVTERRLQLAGIWTAVLEGGEGPPVVLLHGPGEHAAKWMLVIPRLVQTHRVIAPDLPAHGSSAVTGGPLTAKRVIDWLDELIEATCDSPPVLCGQIIGGAIAARFAIAHPGRISRLVLADALGLAPFHPAPEFGQALMEFLSQPNGDTHDRLWQRCAFDLDGLRHRLGDRWAWLRAYNLDRARARGLRDGQQRLMESFGLQEIPAEDLQRIAVPTTLIWGRHDLATPLRVAEAASAHHGWPLLVIENAADDPPLEQPDAFLNALRSLMRRPQPNQSREC